jgi:hypothetical protein
MITTIIIIRDSRYVFTAVKIQVIVGFDAM